VINEAHTTLTLVGCSKPSLKERSQFKNWFLYLKETKIEEQMKQNTCKINNNKD
jgi:hypothetical protein